MIFSIFLFCFVQDTRKKLSEMENKRKNSGEEAERLRNALQEAQVRRDQRIKKIFLIFL